ncbi:hypothetical protein EDB89DRAFT_1859947 [Lactarius sanguifluus]|nr:hypothetical protein EDB89DRAFT_1859947 [Lactarius sanguifluus]
MLLSNIAPHSGLANGSRGVVTDIILDPRENIDNNDENTIRLAFPPTVILFKPLIGKEIAIETLPQGIVPIFPSESAFLLAGKGSLLIKRWQFALTPAYAFTDYKSQGQTLECVIVDIAKPPSGCLTAFNAYVALSRSRGRKTIRLL